MSNSVTISGVTLRNTVSVQQLAPMPAVHVPVLRAGRAFNGGRIQNDEAFIGQIQGVENVRVAVCRHCESGCGPWTACVVVPGLFGGSCCNCYYNSSGSRCSIRHSQVLAPVIPGMALANNFGGSLGAPAPAPGPSGPRHVAPALIGPVGSFQPSSAGLAVPALAPAPAPALAPAGPLLAKRLHNLTKTFQDYVLEVVKMTCSEQKYCRA
ncbi:hypothetical protein B7463_g3167, partial [Scytalidium lignicola]